MATVRVALPPERGGWAIASRRSLPVAGLPFRARHGPLADRSRSRCHGAQVLMRHVTGCPIAHGCLRSPKNSVIAWSCSGVRPRSGFCAVREIEGTEFAFLLTFAPLGRGPKGYPGPRGRVASARLASPAGAPAPRRHRGQRDRDDRRYGTHFRAERKHRRSDWARIVMGPLFRRNGRQQV
jgi:hypothetical protein